MNDPYEVILLYRNQTLKDHFAEKVKICILCGNFRQVLLPQRNEKLPRIHSVHNTPLFFTKLVIPRRERELASSAFSCCHQPGRANLLSQRPSAKTQRYYSNSQMLYQTESVTPFPFPTPAQSLFGLLPPHHTSTQE